MKSTVTSRFSISSTRFDSKYLKEIFPWSVLESSTLASRKKVGFHVTVFDLGIGKHVRIDQHLTVAKTALLKHESELNSLFGECKFALWITYWFPPKDGAINVSDSISAALGLLRVELIFHLKTA
jgi:hypothetical protein